SRFKEVNHAFDVLGDPKRRALYDEFGEEGLREGFDAERMRAYKQWGAQRGGGGGGFGQGVSLEDLCQNGGSMGGSANVRGDLLGGRGRRGPRGGDDVESETTIDLASAVRGTTVQLRSSEGGPPVQVRIPAGATEGSRVRIAGQGGPGRNGGPNGDLILVVHV